MQDVEFVIILCIVTGFVCIGISFLHIVLAQALQIPLKEEFISMYVYIVYMFLMVELAIIRERKKRKKDSSGIKDEEER